MSGRRCLRPDAVSIAREEGTLFHVCKAQDLLRQALEPDRESAVGRAPELKNRGIVAEPFERQSELRQGIEQHLVLVDPASTRSNLEAAKEQIEAHRLSPRQRKQEKGLAPGGVRLAQRSFTGKPGIKNPRRLRTRRRRRGLESLREGKRPMRFHGEIPADRPAGFFDGRMPAFYRKRFGNLSHGRGIGDSDDSDIRADRPQIVVAQGRKGLGGL